MPDANDELTVYRLHLPHWRLDVSIYFVTWRVAPDQYDLESDEREVVCSALRHFEGQRYELSGFVVMNDHVHVLFQSET